MLFGIHAAIVMLIVFRNLYIKEWTRPMINDVVTDRKFICGDFVCDLSEFIAGDF